jgi:hypothetical protein
MWKKFLILIINILIPLMGWCSETPGSDTAQWTPNKNKELELVVPKLNVAPVIDGILDDEAWKGALKTGNFTEIEPGDNVKPKVETEVLLGYDQDNIYVGFICYESDTSKIRKTLTKRDEFTNDDYVRIILDTFNHFQSMYRFIVNPYGVQIDGVAGVGGDNYEVDFVWESNAKILDNRWEAELKIPFKSLRFPRKKEQHWRINFGRTRTRESEEMYSWVPISRDNPSPNQMGHLWIKEKIRGSGENIELLPYFLGYQNGELISPSEPYLFLNDKPSGTMGLSAKYGITSNLTLDLAFNPDYSQIETDVAQIDVNTNWAFSYPEKRPFFLEREDIFRTPISIVYTRSINDPLFAAKLSGKIGKTDIGYIIAQDEHTPWIVPFEEYSFSLSSNKKSLSNIFRLKQSILQDSYLGILFTDRQSDSSFNWVAGIDGSIRFRNIYNLSFQALKSWSKEPNDTAFFSGSPDITFGKYTSGFDGESFSGIAWKLELSRDARYWDFDVCHVERSPEFRADNGFVRSNNYKGDELSTGITFRPNRWMIEQIEPEISASLDYNYDGVLKTKWIGPSLFVGFKKQTKLLMFYNLSSTEYGGKGFEIWRTGGEISTDYSKLISGGVHLEVGRDINYSALELGYYQSLYAWGEIRPTKKMRMEFEYNRYWLWEKRGGKEIYDASVMYNKTTYQFSRKLSLRAVTQYDAYYKEIEFDPLLSYEPNPFTVFYIGFTSYFEDFGAPLGFKRTKHQFFVKFSYLFKTTA